jgi:hypothetical protein
VIRTETPEAIDLVENNGQIKRLDPNAVELRKPTNQSLMPTGLSETIGPEKIPDLLAYLIRASQRN